MTLVHPIHGLYLITADVGHSQALLSRAEAALAGGARVLQYRDKGADTGHRLAETQALAALCRQHGAAFIVNDDIELAAAVGAGVHLGRDDAALPVARQRLGAAAIIGISCYDSVSRAQAAEAAGADYVAFGSFYPSSTKPLAVRPPLSLLTQAKQAIKVPLVAIGGIEAANAPALIAAGADAVAVISSVFLAADPKAAAAEIADLFEER
jgi:thiamine-phosphate pyrophosphorylase